MKFCNDILITNLYSLDVIPKALDYTKKMKNKGEKLTLQRHLEKLILKSSNFLIFIASFIFLVYWDQIQQFTLYEKYIFFIFSIPHFT